MRKESNRYQYKELLQYFYDEFKPELLYGQNKPDNKNDFFLLDIFNRINDVHSVFDRLNRYSVYFESFYADPLVISEDEALEYHLSSYLQEIYSFREKIKRLLNILKKGSKLFNIKNTDRVNDVISHLQVQLENGLTKVLDIRGKHVHDTSVRDFDITKAKAIKLFMGMENINKIPLEEKYGLLVSSTKQKYIAQAKNNEEELLKLMNFISCRMGHLVSSYFGHNTERFSKLF